MDHAERGAIFFVNARNVYRNALNMSYHTGFDFSALPMRKLFARLTILMEARNNDVKFKAAIAGAKLK